MLTGNREAKTEKELRKQVSRCAVCGRKKRNWYEGKTIDGRFFLDWEMLPAYRGYWVCSASCYAELYELTQHELHDKP